jgi:hypothetical protein
VERRWSRWTVEAIEDEGRTGIGDEKVSDVELGGHRGEREHVGGRDDGTW